MFKHSNTVFVISSLTTDYCFFHQARVSLPGGLAMHSIPGRQVCIDTGLPPFFHMHPPAHAHAPAPSSPQPPPSPHSSHTHKVGAGCHAHSHTLLTAVRTLSLTHKQSLYVHLIVSQCVCPVVITFCHVSLLWFTLFPWNPPVLLF